MRPRIEEYNSVIARLFPDGDKKIRTVTVQVTDACNLRCTYCYQIAKKNHYISFETAQAYLKQVLDGNNPYINFDNTNGMILEFIGGEPLLAIDLIHQITEWVWDYMIDTHHPWLSRTRISICSNGTLYFDERVQNYLRQFHTIVSLTFSIDGNKKLHDSCRIFPDGRGSYDMAIAAVKHWVKAYNYNILPDTKLTLSPDNIQYYSEAIIDLIRVGYTHINCNCCFEEGWEIQHATILYHEMCKLTDWLFENNKANDVYISMYEIDVGKMETEDNNWCGGNGEMIAVDWKGDIYPCIRYMESSLGDDAEPIIIGSVEKGIATTQKQIDCINCMKSITRSSQSPEKCMTCPISRLCAWCTGYNYQKFGTVNKRATYICEMHKARVLANLYFWKKWKMIYPNDLEQGIIENHVPKDWAVAIIGEEELDKLNRFLES